MKRFRFLLGVLGMITAAFIGGAQEGDTLKAQENPNVVLDSAKSHGAIDVQPHDTARLPVRVSKFDNWMIGIHLTTDKTREDFNVHAVHGPVLFPIERTGGPTDVPSIIHDLRYESDGAVHAHLRFLLTTPELRTLCAETLFKARPDLMATWKLSSYRELKVAPWPIIHLVVRCFQGGPTGKLLAVGQTGSLTRADESTPIVFQFSEANYQRFEEGLSRGEIVFVPYYTYKGVRISENASTRLAQIESEQLGNFGLSSEQLAGTKPIFQSDVNRVVSQLKAQMHTNVYVTDATLLPMLMDGDDLASRLFETQQSMTWQKLNDPENGALLEMVRQYLTPHLKQFQEATGRQVQSFSQNDTLAADNSRNGSRNGSETVTTVSGGASAAGSIGGFSVGGSAAASKTWRKFNENYSEEEQMDQEMKSLQNATGMTFTRAIGSSEFVPHSIKIYRMKSGASSMTFKDVRRIYRAIGAEERYLEDSPVNGLWTDKVLRKFIYSAQ